MSHEKDLALFHCLSICLCLSVCLSLSHSLSLSLFLLSLAPIFHRNRMRNTQKHKLLELVFVFPMSNNWCFVFSGKTRGQREQQQKKNPFSNSEVENSNDIYLLGSCSNTSTGQLLRLSTLDKPVCVTHIIYRRNAIPSSVHIIINPNSSSDVSPCTYFVLLLHVYINTWCIQ